ncbi:hypothetical protein [Conexibacter sp. SYSU D00693]|uniref:hypothetical protein n=1 Tax=Conexibacter sp. SYSU D00693 TaxID=2812560 RepID=UPI00196AC0CB|nr:hypothetical protein [Conexibacter sp. SYSU D00693]
MAERTAGRFNSDYADDRLLDLVADVAEHAARAAGTAPWLVTQSAWDAARPGAGHPSAPSARQVVARLATAGRDAGMGWRRVLRLAVDEGDRGRRSEALLRARRLDYDARDTRYALRVVAARVDGASPSPSAYDAQRAKLIARRGQGAQLHATLLPTANQITAVHGTWDAALADAGLAARPPSRPGPGRPQAPGLPVVDVLVAFMTDNDYIPSHRILRRYATDARVRMTDRGGRQWAEHVHAASETLRRQGLPVPERRARPGRGNKATYVLPAPGALTNPPALRTWDEAAAIDALARWLRSLPAGAKRTQKAYLQAYRDVNGPPPSRLADFGGFTAMRTKAEQQIAQNRG